MRIKLKIKLLLTLLFIFFLSVTVFTLSYFGLNSKKDEITQNAFIHSTLHKLHFQLKNRIKAKTLNGLKSKRVNSFKKTVTAVFKKYNLSEFLLFNGKGKILLKKGSLELSENFKPSHSRKNFRNFWKSLVVQFNDTPFYLEIARELDPKLYIPFFSNKKISWILFTELDENFIRAIPTPQDPNFWLRWILGLVLILFITAASFIILQSLLIRPLNTLDNTLDEINSGNFATLLGFQNSGDEFEFISDKLNSLSENYERILEKSRQFDAERNQTESMLELQYQLISTIQEETRESIENKNINGIDIYTHQVFSGSFTGDFFDIISLPNNDVVFFVMDAPDHTTTTGLLTLSVIHYLRKLIKTELDPAQILVKLNQHFSKLNETSDYFSAFVLYWSRDHNEIRYANAGFPPGIINSNGEKRSSLTSDGHPVGALSNISSMEELGATTENVYKYETKTVPFDEGDSIMLFSKGLVDHIEKDFDLIWQDINDVVKNFDKQKSARELALGIYADVFSQKEKQAGNTKDQTIIVLKRVREEMTPPKTLQEDSLDDALALSNGEFDEYVIDFSDEPAAVEPFSDESKSSNTEIFETGLASYKSKNFEDALSYFEDYLSKEKDDLEATLYYGDTLFQLDENEKALEEYQKILPKVPDDPDMNFKVGLLNFRLGNLGDAASKMEKAIELKTSYGDAWLYAGVSYANAGNYDDAITVLEKARKEGIYKEEVDDLIDQINERRGNS